MIQDRLVLWKVNLMTKTNLEKWLSYQNFKLDSESRGDLYQNSIKRHYLTDSRVTDRISKPEKEQDLDNEVKLVVVTIHRGPIW